MCDVQKLFLNGAHNTKGLRRKTVLCDSENFAEANQPAREQSSELKVARDADTDRRRNQEAFLGQGESFLLSQVLDFRFHLVARTLLRSD